MSECEEKSRKASGTMHVSPSDLSSSPVGQAHTWDRGWGLYRHRWLQLPLLSPHVLVPGEGGREGGRENGYWKNDVIQKVVLTFILFSGLNRQHHIFYLARPENNQNAKYKNRLFLILEKIQVGTCEHLIASEDTNWKIDI